MKGREDVIVNREEVRTGNGGTAAGRKNSLRKGDTWRIVYT